MVTINFNRLRKIDGKIFAFDGAHELKASADAHADRARANGYLARVQKIKKGMITPDTLKYAVWTHRVI